MKYQKWIDKNCCRLDGKNIIVTGANSGLGLEASKVFAYLGANVIMACRSIERAKLAKNEIIVENPHAKIEIMKYDQSSLVSIHEFVNNYISQHDDLFALINNAGIYHPQKDSKASNGYPLTMMTNFYGGYYLTSLLIPYIKKQKKCTITFECSVAANFTKVNDYRYLTESMKDTNIEYNLSKMAVGKEFVYYCNELKNEHNINVMMSHPGITPTNIFSSKGNSFNRFFKKIAKTFLPMFVHPVAKACLGLVLTVAGKNINNYTYLGPRGIAQLSGFPHEVKVSKYIVSDIDVFMNKVNENIKVMEEHECLK